MHELREEVLPAWPVRLPVGCASGVTRRRGRVLERVVHEDGVPVVLRVAQPEPDRVVLGATATDRAAAEAGLRRLRFWTAVDDDLTPFWDRFCDDPLIGPSLRAAPWTRPFRRATPFEALVFGICEQLVDDERARQIKRALVRAHGRRHPGTGLLDAPDPRVLARLPPPQLQRAGLSAQRASALIRCAREVATGRVDLDAAGEDARVAGWRRLRAVRGVGAWTVSVLALHGQGVHDALPAGDHAYRVAVAAALDLPMSAVDEARVADFMTPYAGWRGVAGWHLLLMDPAEVRERWRRAVG